MNKTLPALLMLAVAVALVAAPTTTACYMPNNPTANYVVCDRSYVGDITGFAIEEAGEAVAFVIDFVTGIPH